MATRTENGATALQSYTKGMTSLTANTYERVQQSTHIAV